MRVLGMISGTSFDGVDVAVADLRFEGDRIVLRRIGELTHPFPADVRAGVAALLPPRTTTIESVCQIDTRLGHLFAEAAQRGVDELADGDVELIASHGQTVFHWVEDGRPLGTLQLGQPAWIAARTGRPVVADLRSRDLAHGGHGAPLASTLDVLLLGRDAPTPRAALNLGGIANLTVVGGGRAPIAFDTGPANGLLDVAVAALTDGAETFDRDGRRAAAGTVDPVLLDRLLTHPFYASEPPKSTGKEHFHLPYLEAELEGRPVDADVLATLVALTAESVARSCRALGVTEVVASGGGLRNPTLIAALRDRLEGVPVRPIDELGLPADDKEAYVFALLGFLTVHDLPGVIAGCTGSDEVAVLGTVVPGRAGLPRPSATPGAVPQRLVVEVGG